MVEEKINRKRLLLLVTIAHIATYILCGLIFAKIMGYEASFEESDQYRNMDELIVGLAPVFQIFRGMLFGVVFILLEKSMFVSKHSWIKIWLILIILGIFNTPGTSPGSIEGFIYLAPSGEPLNIEIGGMLEILTQTLLFSITVNVGYWRMLKKSDGTNNSPNTVEN